MWPESRWRHRVERGEAWLNDRSYDWEVALVPLCMSSRSGHKGLEDIRVGALGSHMHFR